MKKENYSEKIVNAIETFLSDNSIAYTFDPERGLFLLNIYAGTIIKKVFCAIDVRLDCYLLYVVPPIGADKKDTHMMLTMSDFICRANYGMERGNFELDMRDGEIRFKYFVDCGDNIPTNDTVANSIFYSAYMLNKYEEGILNIIFAKAEAEESIECCENFSLNNDNDHTEDSDTADVDLSEEADNFDGVIRQLFVDNGGNE